MSLVDDLTGLADAAWVDLYDGAPAVVRRDLGVEVVTRGSGRALVCPAIDHVFFNRALSIPGAQAKDVFASRGVRRFFVRATPGDAAPPDLEQFYRDWNLYRRSLVGFDVSASRGPVRPATPDDGAAVADLLEACFEFPAGAGRLLATAIGRPSWCTLVAERGGRVLAAGLAFARGDGVYLAIGAVAPVARGRGIQRDLMLARLAWAAERSCAFAATETGVRVPGQPNPSADNMRRLGFDVVGRVSHLTPRGTRWT